MLPLLGSLSACLGYLKLSLPLCLFCLLFLFLFFSLLLSSSSTSFTICFPSIQTFPIEPVQWCFLSAESEDKQHKEAPDTPLLRCCPTIASCS
ncbi:hypothetical protein J3E69DRAFT_33984 [Trichoderma sp. SZMC 28015]